MSAFTKINFTTIVAKIGTLRAAILLILIIAAAFYTGYRIGNFYHYYQMQSLSQQKLRLNELYQKLADKTQLIHTLEVELEVERMANQGSQKDFKALEQELYQIKKQLAFYEKVMAPEKQADGLVIDDFILETTSSPNHFRFQVVLVQQLLRKRFAKGYINLSLTGSLNGKPTTLLLDKISPMNKKQRSFSFQYFQIINGEFTLPKFFVPEKINIAVVLPKGKWQEYHRIERDYNWLKTMEKTISAQP